MKRMLLILSLVLSSLSGFAAKVSTISGRVVDSAGDAIGYATVVLSLTGEQIAGSVTDEQGYFQLSVSEGEYEIAITYLGYTSYQASVVAGSDLGEITLEAESTQIDDVVVTSNILRREADRFIVDVANAPSSIGQNGEELLQSSPGVWISDDKISINGNANPKVFVNDRELKMSSDQIMIYLRNLKSTDVSRIEIIPQSGADFDASASSGVIMIYLKRQLDAGVMGSVSMAGNFSGTLQNYSPSATINFQSKKLTLNSSFWYNENIYTSSEDNSTVYSSLGSSIDEIASSDYASRKGGGRIEAIYQLGDRHSIGAEVSAMMGEDERLSTSQSSYNISSMTSQGTSLYDALEDSRNLSATFNYIYKLDSLGSTLKLLADYNVNLSSGFSDNSTQINAVDSLYQNSSSSEFKVASTTLAAEKILSEKLTLKAGLKYTFNDMDSNSQYVYQSDGAWQDLDAYNSDELYSENIGAAYFIASSRIARWSFVAGLRGEYTQTTGRDNLLNKNYMSWFPNLNVSYLLDPTGSNSIVAQYSRSISRPNFWSLNPTRTQTSEYFYTIGNPSLLPEYRNSLSLTYVYKYKYSLTAVAMISQNTALQILKQDEDNPAMTYITSENIDRQASYILSAYLPFTVTKWWNLSTNLTYLYRQERLYADTDSYNQNLYIGYLQSNFTLPRKFNLNMSYYAMSDAKSGNVTIAANHKLSASLSKRLFGDKLSASLKASIPFNDGVYLSTSTDEIEQRMLLKSSWTSPNFGFSLSYNFKAGKEYQSRQAIESSSAEDRARMENNKSN